MSVEPATRVCIHELVDTVRGRDEDYMASIDAMRSFPPPYRRKAQHLGLMRVVGVAGEWPHVVNLWEHTWGGVMADLARQFQDTARDHALESWWADNTNIRSGGTDRLLLPHPCSDDLARLYERRVRASLFLHEIVGVGPAATERFLDAVAADTDALDAEGAFLLGAFRVAWRPGEAVVITGFPSMATMVAATAGATALAEARRARGHLVRRSTTMVMLPARSNPFGPERDGRRAWTFA